MESNINQIILSGKIGTIPTIKTTGDKKMAFLSLATNEYIKTEQGEFKRLTVWHKVVLQGKLAIITENLLTIGSAIKIAGKLVKRKVKRKNGITHIIAEIRANDLVIMGKA